MSRRAAAARGSGRARSRGARRRTVTCCRRSPGSGSRRDREADALAPGGQRRRAPPRSTDAPPTSTSGRSAPASRSSRRAIVVTGLQRVRHVRRRVGDAGRLDAARPPASRARPGPGRPDVATSERPGRQLGNPVGAVELGDPLRHPAEGAGDSRSPGRPRGPGGRRGSGRRAARRASRPGTAVWTPTDAWVAPGPRVTMQTPGRPVSLP